MKPELWHPKYWLAWLGFGALRLVIALPYPVLLRLGRLLGQVAMRLMSRRVGIARDNIERCFPKLSHKEREQMLKENFESLGISVFEIPLAWWASDKRLSRLADVSGLEHLEEAAAAGQGVLLLSAHFTCLEISGRLLSMYFQFDAMYRRSDSPVVEHVMSSRRRNFCTNIIPRDAVKQLLRRLRAGHAVWYAPDQHAVRKKAVIVKFFGHEAATTPATHKLAKLTGAKVVSFMAVRKNDGSGYQLVLEPALEDFPGSDVEFDTQRINDVIERWVVRTPAQYLWIHRRFRTPRRSVDLANS